MYNLSVGIPAYNEEANIAQLLRALLNQREDGFVLQEIIVISDGSTDRTAEIARTFVDARVTVLEQPERIGQAERQSQLFELVTGSIAVLMEADTLPATERYLAELIIPIVEHRADLSQGLPVRMSGRGWIERVLVAQYENYVQHVQPTAMNAVSGRGGRAFSRRLYQQLRWPKDAPEDLYALHWSLLNGFYVALALKAKNQFRVAGTVADFVRQQLKVAAAVRNCQKFFPRDVVSGEAGTARSVLQKAYCFSSFFRNNPVKALTFLMLSLLIAVVAPFKANRFHYRFPGAASTKLLST